LAEPVTLTEAKAQCQMADDATQDTFITSLIAPARAFVERHSRFLFVSGTRTATFNRWGDYLEIFRQPITSITSITYTDDTGTTIVYTGFLVSIGDYSTRISPAIGGSFPALGAGGLITVTYVGGALATTAEEYIIGKRAMLILIGHWFEYREAATTGIVTNAVEMTVKSLLEEISPVSAY
jgi:uncharacterized phiE125 gp8 family phage protein